MTINGWNLTEKTGFEIGTYEIIRITAEHSNKQQIKTRKLTQIPDIPMLYNF